MSASDFSKSLLRVLVYEGGKVDDPRDPGGRTAYGVTQGTFNAYLRTHGLGPHDVFSITNDERSEIYKSMYWDKVCGDADRPGLDFAVFDAAVNSGCGQAGKWLQAALGDAYTGQIDGQIGAKTLQAIEDHGDIAELVTEFCSRRLGTLKRLRTWSIYGKGWHARISNVQKIAVEWADKDVAAPLTVRPVDVTALKGHVKAPVGDNIKAPPVSQIAAHVTTAASSVSTIAAASITQLGPVADMFSWVKYLTGGLTLASVFAGVAIKVSTDANSAAQKGVAKGFVDPDADANLVSVGVDDKAA